MYFLDCFSEANCIKGITSVMAKMKISKFGRVFMF